MATRIHERPPTSAAAPIIDNVVTLREGPVPIGGRVREPYAWLDVLRTPPPQHLREPARAYCVPAHELLAGALRVESALLVSLGPDGRVRLEHRIGVERRALAGAIRAEREAFARVPRVRPLTRGLAALPDKVRRHARKSVELLSTSGGRARFRAGLRDPRALTGEQKAITLFVGTLALVGLVLAAHVIVTLAAPELARSWRAVLLLFAYGYVSSLGVPLPWEPALVAGAMAVGILATLAVAVAAKLVAGYMVFFLGEEVNEGLERRARRHAWFARFLSWSERFAQRWGVWAMALFIGTPGLPDAVALYLFGSLRMPMWKYLLGIAIGAAALDSIVLFGLGRLLHFG